MTVPTFAPIQASGLSGFNRRQRTELQEAHNARVASATQFIADIMTGRTPYWQLAEAIQPSSPYALQAIAANYPGIVVFREEQSRSDFPLLTGDILDRMMLGKYRAYNSSWRAFTKVSRGLRDFRTVRRLAVNGLEGSWDDIPEGESHERGALSEQGYTYTPKLYGRGAILSFQMIMNDDLGAFEDIPERLGVGGARTIARFVTGLYCGASGPDSTFFSGGNGNVVTSNPVLSISALNTAFTILGSFTDSADGQAEPIIVEEAVLVIPPALRVTANNLLNQLTVDITNTGGASGQTIRVNNWIVNNLTLAIDPFIPLVATSANGATSWFLFADKSVGRPAMEVGFLNGFEEPALYQKAPNAMRVGGGLDSRVGDFDYMSTEYKGVLGFGGTMLDPKGAVASNGSAS